MQDHDGGEESVNVAEYITRIQEPLPDKLDIDNGILIFSPQSPIIIQDGSIQKSINAYSGLFISDESERSELSQPLIGNTDFHVLFSGTHGDTFTISPATAVHPLTQVVCLDVDHVQRRKFSLPHELGHAYLNWKHIGLLLAQSALTGQNNKGIAHLPEIQNYVSFIRSVCEKNHVTQIPTDENELLQLRRRSSPFFEALAVFDERYAWGVGLALSSLYPGFSTDWLQRDGLEQATKGLSLIHI